MARRPKPGTRPVSGILLVDKPSGETSNRTLQRMRRLYAAQKAGHTGTLDPMATGMLPVCFGSATRVSGLMLEASKRYRVTARFGAATDTGDAAGVVIAEQPVNELSHAEIETAVSRFRGEINQTPPMYSALKHNGRRLYELARQGIVVERKSRLVRIHELLAERLVWPDLTLLIHCSKGTYVRSLVADIAGALGTLAHVTELRRLAVGPYAETRMVAMSAIEAAAEAGPAQLDALLLGIDTALMDRPSVAVSESEAIALTQGRRVQLNATPADGSVRIYTPGGGFVGLGNLSAAGELRPSQIFVA